MKTILLCLSSLLAVSSARMAFQFAAGFEDLIDQLDETFSCADKPYGYYADTNNGCKVFHVCNPITDDNGEIVSTDHFSFICGNKTIFNQESLTCTYEADAGPCDEAPTLYELVNAEFGRRVLRARNDEIATPASQQISGQDFSQGDQDFGQGDQDFGQGDQDFGQGEQEFGQGDQDFGLGDQDFGQVDQDFEQSGQDQVVTTEDILGLTTTLATTDYD